MTTTPTIDDYEHPSWCDLPRCSPEKDGGGMHSSVGTMLPLGAAHVTMALFLDDDRHPVTGKLSNAARIRFAMEDMESMGLFCDAHFEPADARLLAQVLVRYADLCDSARSVPYRFAAKTLQREARQA